MYTQTTKKTIAVRNVDLAAFISLYISPLGSSKRGSRFAEILFAKTEGVEKLIEAWEKGTPQLVDPQIYANQIFAMMDLKK